MATRDTTTELIAWVRTHIADESDSPQFTDEAIEATLDLHARHVVQHQLTTIWRNTSTGSVGLRFETPGVFEPGATLETALWAEVTADGDGGLTGVWTFNSEPAHLPLYVTGTRHDLYAAAGDLLDRWVAVLEQTAVKFKVDDFEVDPKDQVAALRARAADMWSRADQPSLPTATVVTVSRDDVAQVW